MATIVSKISVPKGIVFRNLADEVIILNRETNQSHVLNTPGARMWSLLVQHGQIEPAYRAMLDEYDVSEEQLLQDMLSLVDSLASRGLVQIEET